MERSEDTNTEIVEGIVVATRTLDPQDSDFHRATLNSFSFRGLEGGTYKLVKVSDDIDQ